jgi:phosphatidylglycerol---prolipoprotein diacylglyceryl transferase
MHPILIKIGSFHLPTYGPLLASGFLLAIYTVLRLGRREGLDQRRLLDLSTWVILVGLIGAKVLMIVTDWNTYRQAPGEVFSLATLEAGGVFYGGFIAATLFAAWYVYIYKLPVRKIFDIYSPAIALGQSIGRLGCFAAGCDYGKPTNSFLAVVFRSPLAHEVTGVPLGVPLHPTQVYESLATLAIFVILLWRYRHKTRDGQIFLTYLVLYAVARFFLEFLRGDADRGFVFNHLLSTSQFIAILALLAAAGLTVAWYGRARKPGASERPGTARVVAQAKRVRG